MIDKGLAFEYALIIEIALVIFLFGTNVVFILRRRGFRLFRRNSAKHAEKIQDPQLQVISANIKPGRLKIFFSKTARAVRKVTGFLARRIGFLKRIVSPVVSPVWHYKIILINVIIIPVIIFLGIDLLKSPGIIWHYPIPDGTLENFTRPITVEFDRPFNTTQIRPYIFPEIQGEWIAEPVFEWMPSIKRKLVFHPKESMFPGKVFVYYAGIRDVFNFSEKWEYGINAQSVPLPEILDMYPKDGAADVSVIDEIQLHLSSETGKFVEWKLEIVPEVGYEYELGGSNFFKIKFPKRLKQSTLYTAKMIRTAIRYNLETGEEIERMDPETVKEFKFTTVKEPLFASLEPSGEGVLATAEVKVVFDTEMRKETVETGFSMEPAVEGDFSWDDDKTMHFKPKAPLNKDTDYKIKFAANLRSKIGGVTEKEVEQPFKTIGHVKVSGFNPGGGASNVNTGANINVTFNQAVDHGSTQSKFSFSPSVAGNFSWSGNTLVFNPNGNLNWETTYTVSVASGVKTVNGLDSNQNFSTTFRTAQEVFVLNVPVYYQNWQYSCNLVAMQMALRYKGVSTSVSSLHSNIAKDSTPFTDGSPDTWGNPYSGFVGDVTGVGKGYGVYWQPVRNMVSGVYGRSTGTVGNRAALLNEVSNGNPVVIWGHNGYSSSENGPGGSRIDWQTPGGTNIYAIAGMHSFVVVGWRGNIENPSHIILNDPNRGRWTITTGYFDSLWSYFNVGVVVY